MDRQLVRAPIDPEAHNHALALLRDNGFQGLLTPGNLFQLGNFIIQNRELIPVEAIQRWVQTHRNQIGAAYERVQELAARIQPNARDVARLEQFRQRDLQRRADADHINGFGNPNEQLDIADDAAFQELERRNPQHFTSQNDAMATRGEAEQAAEPQAFSAARSSATTGSNSAVSKETPISIYPTLTYGLQETHTTILPWTGWLTAVKLDHLVPAQLPIRMNCPVDMLNITPAAGAPAAGGVFPTRGFAIYPANDRGLRADIDYPTYYNGLATERPAWREFWFSLYEYYTVLGCEYKITIKNPVSARGADVIVGTQMDVYSDAAGSSGNVMPKTNLWESMSFKNIKWNHIESSSDAGNTRAVHYIEGVYKPGQGRRNIINDGDVKTWTSTNPSGSAFIPNLKEFLTLNFWRGPMATAKVDTLSTNPGNVAYCANMQIELKYIVQFKDLKEQARYPNTVTTDKDIQLILDDSTASNGTAHMNP